MARGASALVRRRGVRVALGAAVVLVAASAVAVANVALLHVAGSPAGEVGSLSARLPGTVTAVTPVTAPAPTTATTAPAATTAAAATSPEPEKTAPAATSPEPAVTRAGDDRTHDGDRDDHGTRDD